MKRFFFTTFLLSLLFVSLNAQLLLSDDFSYSGLLTNNTWAAHSGAGTNSIATGPGLSFTSYPGSGIGNAAVIKGTGEDVNKTFSSSVSSGVVYMSFLITVNDTLATTGDYFTGFYATSSTFFARTFVKKNADNTFEFGIGKTSASTSPASPVYTTGNYTFGTTYLVVIKYEYLTGSTTDDIASIFVFNTIAPNIEPTPNQTNNVGTDATAGLVGVLLRQGTVGNKVGVTVDGIRVGTTWSGTIPVELVDFKAQKANSSVKLIWSTATELNNAYYEIERSENGKSFEKIGEISGYGNSQVARSYSFIDEKPSNTVNYYRLRQVDFDGKATVSKTVSVDFGKNTTAKIYPSVVKENLNIDFNTNLGSTELFIVNSLGQVLKSQKLSNTEGGYSLNVSDIPNGFYLINIVSKSGNMTQRFEKQ